jgi:hypothetical protein
MGADLAAHLADLGPLRLAAYTVSGEREGNAKAIMEQRNSMNITNSVASETFGDVSEGNIGEFLKHLPGVEIDLNADKAQGRWLAVNAGTWANAVDIATARKKRTA